MVTPNARSEAASSTEEVVKLNDPLHQGVCSMCHQPIKNLKHTIICGCGSKIKNKIKFK
ncbi:hypothetical protein [Paenibacillus macerans]|uniref:hypothetical protein n=1 Tax=Paenibacillus macerans TaxID=44252 RepID=UPI00203F60BD|nr:hypothetical protein [Paenibacillus macerans]MCM3700287.1 hypothetical protein [Paenibacillus macerans]